MRWVRYITTLLLIKMAMRTCVYGDAYDRLEQALQSEVYEP